MLHAKEYVVGERKNPSRENAREYRFLQTHLNIINMENAVYKLNLDCGRMGSLEGLFIAQKEHVTKLIESKINVYFGEVLGKHSEVYCAIGENDIVMVSDASEVIKVIEEFELSNGHNPFDYTTVMTGRDDFDDLTVNEVLEILISEEK